MKKLLSYLIPILIMLIVFYTAASLISATLNPSKMDITIRSIIFGWWLACTCLFSLGKAMQELKK